MPFPLTRMQSYLLLLLSVFVLGTLAIMLAEGLSFFDALYFVVVTIATVGYGDITPTDNYGKAITITIIIVGVGTFVAVIADLIENILSRGEQRSRRKKINMIIGIFFSEIGTDLLRLLSSKDPCIPEIRKELLVTSSWTRQDFERLKTRLSDHQYCILADSIDLPGLKQLLTRKKEFLLSLLENPVIFEHDSFTDTLQAFFHLTEELLHRQDPVNLHPRDSTHLMHDINRGYRLLVFEWVGYMEHLQEHYPYLFSLAMRTNPFDPGARAEISEEQGEP